MKRIYIITLLSFFCTVFGQSKKDCNCPINQFVGETKATTIFNLSSGNKIVLCGFKNSDNTFSEFVLSVCGESKIIDFWDATLTCRIETNKDTLLVQEIQNLPVGKKLEYQPTVWTTEKIYFSKEKVIRKLEVNKKIGKYNQEQINKILKIYENAKPEINEWIMGIANNLFIASISGNKKAKQYLKDFEKKFGKLDGAFAEEYKELLAMLNLWEHS
jgi:hypothetical protein